MTRAVAGQNGIRPGRDIFQRLAERGLSLEALVRLFETRLPTGSLVAELDRLLQDPYYAAFTESALALSDARTRELITDTAFWEETCRDTVFGSAAGGWNRPPARRTRCRRPWPRPWGHLSKVWKF